MARQNALMSLHALAKPLYEAGRAVRRLNEQIASTKELLGEHADAPEDLAAAVDSLADEIDELREDINQANRDARLQGAIEGSDAGPTTDQLWQIDRAWEIIPPLIEKLNDIVTSRIPAINRRLDAAGIRANAVEAIAMPSRRGR